MLTNRRGKNKSLDNFNESSFLSTLTAIAVRLEFINPMLDREIIPELKAINDNLAKLNRKLDLIFGDNVLLDGHWVDLNKLTK